MPVRTPPDRSHPSQHWTRPAGGPMACAASVLTRATSGFESPFPSGCTRFVRTMTNRSLSGSIHNEVPVNPKCPNAVGESPSPLHWLCTLQPSVRMLPGTS